MSDLFIPSSPKSIPLRPLTKGMIRNLPTQMIPQGAGWDVKNFFVNGEGLTLRDGWTPLYTSYPTTYGQVNFSAHVAEQIQDILMFLEPNGTSAKYFALTNRRLYKLDATTLKFEVVALKREYTLSSHTYVAPNGTITDSTGGRDFVADKVRTGDYVRYLNDAGGYTEYVITNVATATLTVTGDPSNHAVAAPKFYVVHEFTVPFPNFVDYTYTPNAIIFADGSARGIMTYNGTTGYLDDLEVHGILGDDIDYLLGAQTCLYVNGYLYLGNTQETGSDGRRIIRWSSATDLTEFAQADYINFVESGSPVMKISSIENIPMVYTYDKIYAGFPSTFVGLPFQFVEIETGGISAVGMKSMCSYLNGQLFIGRDNIYFVQPNRSVSNGTPVLEIVGSPVANVTSKLGNYRERSIALYDPTHECVHFAFDFSKSKRIEKIFMFFPETKAWSYMSEWPMSLVSLNAITPFASNIWNDFNSTHWDDISGIWLDYGITTGSIILAAADSNGFVYYMSQSATSDTQVLGDYSTNVQNISYLFESGDMDFGDPDSMKTMVRLGIKTSQVTSTARTADLDFAVQTSTDNARNWTTRDTIEIETTNDKDECHFREKGSAIRFRISGNTDQPKFRVDEVLLRVRGGAREDVRG